MLTNVVSFCQIIVLRINRRILRILLPKWTVHFPHSPDCPTANDPAYICCKPGNHYIFDCGNHSRDDNDHCSGDSATDAQAHRYSNCCDYNNFNCDDDDRHCNDYSDDANY